MIMKENRTDAYLGTVNLSDPEDMEMVKNTRKMVKDANNWLRACGKPTLYVKLQGRGHRMGNRLYHQSLPLKYAKTADMYVYSRSK